MQRLIHAFESNSELSRQLSNRIASNLAAALMRRGKATLAVSGGTTPQPLFEALALEPLDWSRVTVIPVDERWVEEEHADSNAGLIKRYLLQNKAATAHFVGMKTPSDSAFESESEVNIKLAPYASCIDVAVLGMGEDGHTASFFPGAQTLPRAMDPAGTECCVAVRPPTAEHDRMTLSLSALLRARHAYLHIAGLAKQEVLSLASEPGDTATMPIRALLHSDSLELDIYFAKRN